MAISVAATRPSLPCAARSHSSPTSRTRWLTVYVGEPDLARNRIGQEAEVITDDGQRRTGRISFISPVAEFTQLSESNH